MDAGEQDADEGDPVVGGERLRESLVVAAQPTMACQPAKGSLDHPPTWQQHEPLLRLGVLHNFKLHIERLGCLLGVLAGVALVNVSQFDCSTGRLFQFSTHMGDLMTFLRLGPADDLAPLMTTASRFPSVSTAM